MNLIEDKPIITMSHHDSTEYTDEEDNIPSNRIVWIITSNVKYDSTGLERDVRKFNEILHDEYKPLRFGTIQWKCKNRRTVVVSICRDDHIPQYSSTYFLHLPAVLVDIIHSYLLHV